MVSVFVLFLVVSIFKVNGVKGDENCEQVVDSYVVFRYFENNKIEMKCSTISEQKDEKFSTDGALMSYDLVSDIALFTDYDAILIDKKSNEKKVLKPDIDDGIIQSVAMVDGVMSYAVNTGLNEDKYISYILIGDKKIDSQGGLITSFIERNGYIYALERKIPSTERILYKYNSEYELISEIDVSGYVSDKIGLNNEGNIILFNENYIFSLDQTDVITKFELDTEEGINDVIIRGNDLVAITYYFNMYQINFDGDNQKLVHGANELKGYSETYLSGCYLTYSEEKIVCGVTYLENKNYHIMNVVYDFNNNTYQEHYVFNFDTKDKKAPSKLILINQ